MSGPQDAPADRGERVPEAPGGPGRRVAIVQARLGSTRLPGKALLDLEGAPMLARVLSRLGRCRRLDRVVVATSDRDRDDVLAAWCRDRGVPVHRGPEDDVLARYHLAARVEDADVVVRITSDCPFIDPAVVDTVVEALEHHDGGYASNTLEPRTFPRGLDVEAFTREALETAHQEDTDPASREHVTPFLRRHPDRFRPVQVRLEEDLSGHRWTVDTPEDLAFARAAYAHFGHDRFTWQELLEACRRHPEWEALNAHVRQKGT